MFSKKHLCLALSIILIITFSSVPTRAEETKEWNNDNIVVTRKGVIEGKTTDGTFSWLGVPYAKPPIGDLRWKAPREPETWEGIKKTTEFGPPSVQYGGIMAIKNEDKVLNKEIIGSENCLSLNIWRPKSEVDNLPVYVFLHGGSNQVGWSGFPMYNGTNLAENAKVVVVTINYRVGVSGWFYHPALKTGNSLDDSGNYGLLDIVQALDWVQNNISRFGGNPNKVTVSGESAGAMDIYQMLMSPYLKENYFDDGEELFQRAVLQSGMILPTSMETTVNDSHELLVKLLLQENRARNENEAEQIIENMTEENKRRIFKETSMENIYKCYEPSQVNSHIDYGMGNYNDGYVIDDPYQRLIKGKYVKVPVIIGSNAEEGKLLLSVTVGKNFKENQAFENAIFGRSHPKTLSSFLDSKYWGAFEQGGKLITTSAFQTLGVETPASLMLHHQDNVYVYRFAWDEQPEPFNFLIGAGHAVEVPFIFNNMDGEAFPFNNVAWTNKNEPGRKALSETMLNYWKNFMETGNPNDDNLPEWKEWKNWPWSKRYLVLDASETEERIWMGDSFVSEDKFLTSSENYLESQMEKEGIEDLDKGKGFKNMIKEAGGAIGGENSEDSLVNRADVFEKSLYLAWIVVLIAIVLAVLVYFGSSGSLI